MIATRDDDERQLEAMKRVCAGATLEDAADAIGESCPAYIGLQIVAVHHADMVYCDEDPAEITAAYPAGLVTEEL